MANPAAAAPMKIGSKSLPSSVTVPLLPELSPFPIVSDVVGDKVGTSGCKLGLIEGERDGPGVIGREVGVEVEGDIDGDTVGEVLGVKVGQPVGELEGLPVGPGVIGDPVGLVVGESVGDDDG